MQALRELDDRPWDTMRSGKGLSAQARGRWLNSFGINSTTLEPEHLKGYERAAFEAAWESYAGTPCTNRGKPWEPWWVRPYAPHGSHGSTVQDHRMLRPFIRSPRTS